MAKDSARVEGGARKFEGRIREVLHLVLIVCHTDENINGKNSKSTAFWSSLNSDSGEFTYELMRLL